MIRLENISKEFPDKILFQGVNLVLKPGMRVGLVGANGSGKTTLLRLMIGEETSDSGNILKSRGLSIGHLPQDIVITSKKSILQEVLSSFFDVSELEIQIDKLNVELAQNPNDEKQLKRLGTLHHQYESLGGWELEDRAKKILSGLGFNTNQFTMPMETLSGGWRMRVALAGLLLKKPDFLFMDEPTNHLDLDATIWLEDFLSSWKSGMILISHDRQFLDRSVSHVWEVESETILSYTGNYSRYIEEKSLRREQQQSAYLNQQKKIAEIERFIERFRYKNTKATQVQSRVKMLEKMEKIPPPVERKSQIRLRIPQPHRSPLKLVTLSQVEKSYGNLQVYSQLDFLIERGMKVGLVGRNGAGKSTLLKLLAGVEPITQGRLEYTPGVKKAYFAQHQLEILNPNDTVFTSIRKVCSGWTDVEIRTFLGGFLFSGETIDKRISVLSGGEKSRLALARILAEPSHILLLDEPTNHLDMVSRDIVETALINYSGAIVCISHDRHFLNAVTHLTAEIGNGKATLYHGNYDYYEWKVLSKHKADPPADRPARQAERAGVKVKTKKTVYREKKRKKNRLQKIKLLLKDIEEEQQSIQKKLSSSSVASDYEKIHELSKKELELESAYFDLLEEQEALDK